MRYKLLHLIPATLVFLLTACAAPPMPRDSAPNSTENFSVSEAPFPEFPTLEQIQTTEYWNTDGVDVSHVDPTRKLVALTFDDAPASTLENILAVFASFNEEHPHRKASATVFCSGFRIDAQTQPLLHAAYALGFELGNHAYSHRALTSLSDEQLLYELNVTDKALQAIDGNPLHLLRAPFGRVDTRVKEFATAPLIDWTIDTRDWTGVSEKEIFDSVMSQKYSGAIVLMHDGYGHTVSALKRILPALEAEGYQAVTVSEMIKAHGCKFRRGQVYIRARKQNGGV